MPGKINKYEAVGILISIVVMALVLAYFKYDPFASSGEADVQSTTNEQGAEVVTNTGEGADAALADALYRSATAGGDLTNLVINDVRVGEGAEVKQGDTVIVHYIGATRDGVQFDSSYQRGDPFFFTVGGGSVIEGWDKGLIGMKVGGQRILVIPSNMAYGNRQVGPIAPNTPLVFAVELLEIR